MNLSDTKTFFPIRTRTLPSFEYSHNTHVCYGVVQKHCGKEENENRHEKLQQANSIAELKLETRLVCQILSRSGQVHGES